MTVRRLLPGFLIGVGLLAGVCWLVAMALLWARVPLLLPSPSDPRVVPAGLVALLVATVALVTGVWILRRAGQPSEVALREAPPPPEGDPPGTTSDLPAP